jgi:hypothetical protein
MIESYRPSGQFGYQLGLYWVPFIFLNFFMTLGVAIACGALMTFVVKLGSSRGPTRKQNR